MKLLSALLAFVVLLAPSAASAAFGQVIPEGCYCPGKAPDWGCALQVMQNLINISIALGVAIATLVIAYAGALWILNPFHAENRKLGRTLLMNAVIGLIIAVGAWLFVDFLMKSLYNPSATGEGLNKQFGPWNEILAEGRACIEPVQTGVQNNGTSNNSNQNNGNQDTQDGNQDDDDDGQTPTGPFPFNTSGINALQRNDASPQLLSLLQCMKEKPGVGNAVVTSISDDWLYSQNKSWAECRTGQCQHCGGTGSNKCDLGGSSYHYGGTQCGNESYAVDFSADAGTAQSNAIIQAAQQCGGRSANEGGNHTHIQIGSCN